MTNIETTAEVDHASRDHALCSASGAERWLNCPGSVGLCLDAPKSEPSKYALEGTRFHELCEKMLEPLVIHYNKTKSLDVHSIGKMLDDLPGGAFENYPLEMREHAQEYVEKVWEIVSQYKPKKLCVEERVFLDEKLKMFGTADLFFAFRLNEKKTILCIIDIKYGAGKVVEADSPQLAYYALAVQETYNKTKFDEFWLHIYQPRAEHHSGETFRRHVLKRKEALELKKQFIAGATKAINMIANPEAEFHAGDHCLFCDAKPYCKAHADYINEQAGLDFTDDPAVLAPAIPEQRSEIRNVMSDEQIGRLLLYKNEIKKFLDALTEYGINRYLEGEPIPGWKVVESRSQRRWDPDNGEVPKHLGRMGVKDPWDKKLRGLGSIEKELKKLHPDKTKQEISDMISPLVTKTIPGKTLVPDSDARPALDASSEAARDFDAITEDAFDD